MTAMAKVKARWHGFTGSPGYSNFYFREWSDGNWNPTQAEVNSAVGRVFTFFNMNKGIYPPVVNIQVESDVEIIEDTTGDLINVMSATPQVNIVGTSSAANYAAGSGAVVNWLTGSVRNGRRVRGRTFLVPMSSSAFENNGTLTASVLANLNTEAVSLATDVTGGPGLGVYCRPTAPGATDGQWFVATGARVPDLAAVLRSRRD